MFEKFEDFNIHLHLDAVWDDKTESDFLRKKRLFPQVKFCKGV